MLGEGITGEKGKGYCKQNQAVHNIYSFISEKAFSDKVKYLCDDNSTMFSKFCTLRAFVRWPLYS